MSKTLSNIFEFIIFCCVFGFIVFIVWLPSSPSVENFQKQAISYGYATYDLNGNFIWIEPKK